MVYALFRRLPRDPPRLTLHRRLSIDAIHDAIEHHVARLSPVEAGLRKLICILAGQPIQRICPVAPGCASCSTSAASTAMADESSAGMVGFSSPIAPGSAIGR